MDTRAFVDAAIGWAHGDERAVEVAAALASEVRCAVLVEGPSDQAALEALASRSGRDLAAEGVPIIAMGGATSIGRFARVLGPEGLDLRLLGLCDAGEESYFRRALGESRYFVCEADLEDELIRALGPEGVEAVIDAQGDLSRLRTFQNQPAQRERSTERQLRRFMGTIKGRKARYARALTEAVDLDRAPQPLIQLLAHTAGAPEPPESSRVRAS